MNLLLLLSALLSALTGVGASVRAPERAQAVAAASIGRSTATLAPARVTQRPIVVRLTLAATANLGVAFAVAAVRAIPAWTDRRRE